MQQPLDLKQLDNTTLISKVVELSQKERAATVELLYYLIELDNRKLYLEAGYSSLFDFCRKKLLYSEGAAQRRILAARCVRDKPELAELLLDGKVSLCTIATAASSIRESLTQVAEIVGKSKKEVEVLVAKTAPRAKPREVIKPLVLNGAGPNPEPVQKDPLGKEAAPTDVPSSQSLPLPAASPEKPAEERYALKFSLPKEVYQKFEKVRAALSNALGKDLSLEAVFTKLIDTQLKERREKPKALPSRPPSGSRYIPSQVKREVFKRDGGRCSYVSKDGVRCGERHYLQFDHVTPYALGGKSEAENLRLVCQAHNGLLAREVYGDDFIARAIERKAPSLVAAGGRV
jgi:hypothetical protein